MTPLQEAEATIVGLEAAISHMRRDLARAEAKCAGQAAEKSRNYQRLKQIEERHYECENQHQPLHRVIDDVVTFSEPGPKDVLRKNIVRLSRYIVFGVDYDR